MPIKTCHHKKNVLEDSFYTVLHSTGGGGQGGKSRRKKKKELVDIPFDLSTPERVNKRKDRGTTKRPLPGYEGSPRKETLPQKRPRWKDTTGRIGQLERKGYKLGIIFPEVGGGPRQLEG